MVGFTNLSRILISMRNPCVYGHAGDALGLPQNPYVESYLNYIVQQSMLWELCLCATLLCQTSICIPAWRTTMEDQSFSGKCFWWLWFPAWFGSDVVGGRDNPHHHVAEILENAKSSPGNSCSLLQLLLQKARCFGNKPVQPTRPVSISCSGFCSTFGSSLF